MGFKFNYLNEQQLEDSRFKVIAEGTADFMIESVKDTDDQGYELKDNNGNAKLEIQLIVKDRFGAKTKIKENLSGAANVAWKTKQLLDSVGLSQAYNQSGEFEPQMLVNRRGKCEVYTRKYTNNQGRPVQVSNVKDFIDPSVLNGAAQQYAQPVQYQAVMPGPHEQPRQQQATPPQQAQPNAPFVQPAQAPVTPLQAYANAAQAQFDADEPF